LHAAHTEAVQRLALDVREDDKQIGAFREDVERRDDVGVADAGRKTRLVDEHRDEVGIARDVRMDPLDGHGAREADRARQAADVRVALPPDAISS